MRLRVFSVILLTLVSLPSGFAQEHAPAQDVEASALLISGYPANSGEVSFKNSVLLAFRTLVEKGVPASRIIVMGEGYKSQDFSPHKVRVIPFAPNQLKTALSSLSSSANKKMKQRYLVYLAGHGSPWGAGFDPNGISTAISPKELDAAIKQGTPDEAEKIVIVDACDSGSFEGQCVANDRIFISSAGAWANSYSKKDEKDASYNHTVFGYHFFSAIRGRYPNGSLANADASGDGEVSFGEAFVWAKTRGREEVRVDEVPFSLGKFFGVSQDFSPELICDPSKENSTICGPFFQDSECRVLSDDYAKILKDASRQKGER